jgi:hypothetical protein
MLSRFDYGFALRMLLAGGRLKNSPQPPVTLATFEEEQAWDGPAILPRHVL